MPFPSYKVTSPLDLGKTPSQCLLLESHWTPHSCTSDALGEGRDKGDISGYVSQGNTAYYTVQKVELSIPQHNRLPQHHQSQLPRPEYHRMWPKNKTENSRLQMIGYYQIQAHLFKSYVYLERKTNKICINICGHLLWFYVLGCFSELTFYEYNWKRKRKNTLPLITDSKVSSFHK